MKSDNLKEIVRKVVEEVLADTEPSVRGGQMTGERISPRGAGKKLMCVALGSDHAGYPLKKKLKTFLLEDMNCSVIDCGANSADPVDYPDIAFQVALSVAEGRCERGIMIDSAGIGSSVTANKVKGIRAALCHDVFTATTSREHTNSNVLTLGSRVLNPGLAKQVVRVWLKTQFSGGRHQKRLDKIDRFEENPR